MFSRKTLHEQTDAGCTENEPRGALPELVKRAKIWVVEKVEEGEGGREEDIS